MLDYRDRGTYWCDRKLRDIKQSIKDSRDMTHRLCETLASTTSKIKVGVGDFRLRRHLQRNGDCFGMMIAY
jgi:hypothetical protein